MIKAHPTPCSRKPFVTGAHALVTIVPIQPKRQHPQQQRVDPTPESKSWGGPRRAPHAEC